MNEDSREWQWVDVDPFEKQLLVERALRELPDLAAGAAPPMPAALAVPIPQPSAGLFAESVPPVAEEVHLRPTDFEIATGLQQIERWEAAAGAFKRALEAEPEKTEARLGLGSCLLHLERAAEALYCFELCYNLGYRRERSLLGKAVALQKLDRMQEAGEIYAELLKVVPEDPEVLANLIALSVERKDAEAVAEYSLRLVEVDPESKAALRGLAAYAAWNHKAEAAADEASPVEPAHLEPGRVELAPAVELKEVAAAAAAANGSDYAASEPLPKRSIASSLTAVRSHLSGLLAAKRQAAGSARNSWSGFYHRAAKESENRAS